MSATALSGVDTLTCVASRKRVEDRYLDHLAMVVRGILDRDFGGKQRGQAEKKLGITQSHISQLMRGSRATRGPGIDSLLQLRKYSGLSLDALLGLPPATLEDKEQQEVLARLEKRARLVKELAELEADESGMLPTKRSRPMRIGPTKRRAQPRQ